MLGYEEELELIRDNVRVIWENIGEGYSGDYNENDPEDKNFLRFTVFVKEDGEWVEVDDSSHCTMTSANADNETLMKLLNVLMDEFYDVLHYDTQASIRGLAGRLSWISESDIVKEKDEAER